jgi:hypothetical protein
MKLRLVFSVLFFCAVISRIFPESLEELVAPEYAQRLRSSGSSVTKTQLKNPSPELLPKNNELRQLVTGVMGALNPGTLVETLYLYKKPDRPPQASGGWSAGQRTGIFNRLAALGTLTGIQYYSASRGTMRTFYEYSSVIDSPASKNPLPDPVFEDVPAGFTLTLFARQKDLTFGDNIYRYDYKTASDSVFFTQENLTPLSYGIIPVIGRGNLRTVMAVIDCGDFLLIYAASMAKAASVPGMADRIGNSFGNRAEAVLKWFTGAADGVFFTLL